MYEERIYHKESLFFGISCNRQQREYIKKINICLAECRKMGYTVAGDWNGGSVLGEGCIAMERKNSNCRRNVQP